MRQARLLDPATFNRYFSQGLIPVLTRDFFNATLNDTQFQLVSSYVSAASVSEASTCRLSQYKLTQQTYLSCGDADETHNSSVVQSKISVNQKPDDKLMLLLFQDASLFGIPTSGVDSNFTDLDRSSALIDFSELNVHESEICSQVAGFILPATASPR